MGWVFGIFILISFTLFMIILVPIGILLSFRKQQNRRMLNDHDSQRINELMVESQRMRDRIKVLESILDQQSPNWRSYNE